MRQTHSYYRPGASTVLTWHQPVPEITWMIHRHLSGNEVCLDVLSVMWLVGA